MVLRFWKIAIESHWIWQRNEKDQLALEFGTHIVNVYVKNLGHSVENPTTEDWCKTLPAL